MAFGGVERSETQQLNRLGCNLKLSFTYFSVILASNGKNHAFTSDFLSLFRSTQPTVVIELYYQTTLY